MKTGTKMLMGAVLAAPLLWVGVTYAEDKVTTTSANTDTPRTVMAEDVQKPSLTPDEQKELKTRLDKRKAELKTKLNSADQQKIKTKCKGTQGNLSSLQGRIKGVETSRTQVYGGLIARLSLLESRLQNQKVDYDELQKNIDELKAKIAVFNTDLEAYKQAVADLTNMDCAADPVAYKASLEAARAALAKLKEDSKVIHMYVTETIKPTLAQIRSKV